MKIMNACYTVCVENEILMRTQLGKEVITVLHFLVYLFRDTEKENKASLAGLGHLTKPMAFIIGNNNYMAFTLVKLTIRVEE